MSDSTLRAHAATHPGRVREQNEDCADFDPALGYYAVFDGMGGHNAGDVASQRARDVVKAYLRNHPEDPPDQAIRAALDAASKSIYLEARRNRELHGMGTTAVVCIVDDLRATIGHAGDSRAYLMRDGSMRQLTRDHTVVAELMSRGALSAEEARHHPYKSVLSRNLGGKPKADSDVSTIELSPGDRLLLCSDGLTGFAAIEAVSHVVSGAEDPRSACADLIELALRGGGGDNVTTVVVEVGELVLPEATQILRTTGASGWLSRRAQFIDESRKLGVAESPICSRLPESEALELIAGNLHEAIYHDLEQTTGIHAWTFAENLAGGWLDQGGDFKDLRELLDSLRAAAMVLISGIEDRGESYAMLLEGAMQRALVVAEMAVAGVVSERIRKVEAEMARRRRPTTTTGLDQTEQRTIPFMGAAKNEPPPPRVAESLEKAYAGAEADLEPKDDEARECLAFAAHSAADYAGEQDLLPAARELVGNRELSETGFAPLLAAVERARVSHLDALAATISEPEVAAAATRLLVRAHHALAMAVAFVTIDVTLPIDEALLDSAEKTKTLRAEVSRGEKRISQLERQARIADQATVIEDDPDPDAKKKASS